MATGWERPKAVPANDVDESARAGRISQQSPEKLGSLADAFSLLNEEIGYLEGACDKLLNRLSPALEPSEGDEGEAKTSEKLTASPLAEAVIEYVLRIRRARQILNDIRSRVSF